MRRKLVGLVVVFVVFLVVGCENNGDITLDETAIQDFISNDLEFAEYFAFGGYYGEADTVTRLRTITNPHTWYRERQNINRNISINISNDSAFVSFWNRVDGVFHVLEIDTSASPDTVIDHQKDLIDESSNYAIFRRALGAAAYRGWRLESLTGASVIGADIMPSDCVWVAIDSVRINCASYEDTLFTTPLMFFGRGELLTFGSQEVVTLTLYSHPLSNIYAYLHARSLGAWRRWRFAAEIEPGVWQDD